jgi:hypothetical protein
MPLDDLTDLFPVTPQQQQLAMANALRGQQPQSPGVDMGQLGVLAALSTGRVAPFAQAATNYGREQREAQGQMLMRALEANRLKQQADYQNKDLDIRRTEANNLNSFRNVELGARGHVVKTPSGENLWYDPINQALTPLTPGGAPAAGSGQASGPPAMKPKDIDAEFQKFSDAISTVKGRGNLSAEQQKRIDAISRVEDLAVDDHGNIRPLSPQQFNMFATDIASVIGNGTPTEAQIKEQNPHTWRGSMASTLQWAFNHPQDAGAQDFVRSALDALATVKGGIQNTMRAHQLQAVPTYAHLRQYNQQRFDSMLQGAGLDPSSLDLNTGLPRQRGGSAPKGANQEPTTASAGSRTGAAPPGTIEMISPDGRHGYVPEANAAKAESQGYKRVQPIAQR